MNQTTDNEVHTGLINEIERLLFEAVTQHQADIEAEKQWLSTNCKNAALLDAADNLTVIAFHILDAIGRFQPTNGIDITKRAGIPKGTVSKNIKKLIDKGLITKTPLPNNKKESFLNLTDLGQELFEIHRAVHRKFDSEFFSFLTQYNTHELQFLARFLKNFYNFKQKKRS
jgi:DNA-binding MarR family transcriptional regulator